MEITNYCLSKMGYKHQDLSFVLAAYQLILICVIPIKRDVHHAANGKSETKYFKWLHLNVSTVPKSFSIFPLWICMYFFSILQLFFLNTMNYQRIINVRFVLCNMVQQGKHTNTFSACNLNRNELANRT